jgi:hypothetical protein
MPPPGGERFAELVAEATRLSARLAAVTAELNTLIGDPQAVRFARYRSPEFTQQLSEHLHAAKKAALEAAGETHAGS